MLDYPVPPPGPPGPFGTMAWLRATVSPVRRGRDARPPPRAGRGTPGRARPGRAARRGGRHARRASTRGRTCRWRCWPRRPASTAMSWMTCGSSPRRTSRGRTRPAPTRRSRRLLERLPAGDEEAVAQHVALLVQACEATAALIRGDDPPVPSTKRLDPDGNVVVVDLAGRPFGEGRRACPAREHALALAEESTMFADLHRPGDPLLLPNAWDHASGGGAGGRGVQGDRDDEPRRRRRDRRPGRRERDEGGDARPRREPRAPAGPDQRRRRARVLRGPAPSGGVRAAAGGARRRRHQPRGPQRRPDSTMPAVIAAVKHSDEPVRERPHRHVLARRRNRNRRALPALHRRRRRRRSSSPERATTSSALANLGVPLNVLFLPGMTVERLASPRRRADQHRLSAVSQSDRRRRRSGDSDPGRRATATRAEL